MLDEVAVLVDAEELLAAADGVVEFVEADEDAELADAELGAAALGDAEADAVAGVVCLA